MSDNKKIEVKGEINVFYKKPTYIPTGIHGFLQQIKNLAIYNGADEKLLNCFYVENDKIYYDAIAEKELIRVGIFEKD
jgi:hypothetical protein